MAPFVPVFSDERLLAVAKPSGKVVIAGRGNAGEPLRAELERSLSARLYVVHRLDREASGLVVFAKDAKTHRDLCAAFERRRVKKTYLVGVLGAVAGDGSIDLPIKEFGSGRMGVAEGGKKSSTAYRVLKRGGKGSLLEAEPATGRRHQLRVHFHALGHPILGDPLYGDDRPVGGAPRLLLHAWKLAFPAHLRLPELVAPPPPDFLAALEAAGLPSTGL